MRAAPENPIEDIREWIRTRPADLHERMIAFPPASIVKTKEGVRLRIPAPGVEGEVTSYMEKSSIIGVAAPLQEHTAAPAMGEVLEKGTVLIAECRPEDLELVRCATIPTTDVVMDSGFVKEALDG